MDRLFSDGFTSVMKDRGKVVNHLTKLRVHLCHSIQRIYTTSGRVTTSSSSTTSYLTPNQHVSNPEYRNRRWYVPFPPTRLLTR
jgi:hypothetical protein